MKKSGDCQTRIQNTSTTRGLAITCVVTAGKCVREEACGKTGAANRRLEYFIHNKPAAPARMITRGNGKFRKKRARNDAPAT